jgi:hypothetical protein
MTFSLQALTIQEENAQNLMENWLTFSNYGTGSLERIFQNAIDLYGGIDCNYQDEKGNTILHIAAANGDIKAVRLLTLELNAPLNAKNKANQTPLDLAKKGLNDLIDILPTTGKVSKFFKISLKNLIETIDYLTRMEFYSTQTYN